MKNVESHKIKSIRFLSLSFFSFGLSILSISVLFALNQEIIFESLRTIGAISVGIAALMMLFQLANEEKKPIYYLFYLPRIIGLLIAWSIASYLL